MGDGKNGNIAAEMGDERRRSKPMKVKKYGEFKVFRPFASFILVFATPSFYIFVGLFCEPSKIGIVHPPR